jgi:hypothetical protein
VGPLSLEAPLGSLVREEPFQRGSYEGTGCHEIGREQFDGGDSGGYLDRSVEAVPRMRQWIERVSKEAGCCLSLAEGLNDRCSCLRSVLQEENRRERCWALANCAREGCCRDMECARRVERVFEQWIWPWWHVLQTKRVWIGVDFASLQVHRP